jgi:hypothetical protein
VEPGGDAGTHQEPAVPLDDQGEDANGHDADPWFGSLALAIVFISVFLALGPFCWIEVRPTVFTLDGSSSIHA